MMRIISGRFKGRAIPLPDPSVARPSTDKIRQAVFNILEHRFLDKPWRDLHALDAFAGSGALGLEALSRGSEHVTFVELHKKTAQTLDVYVKALVGQAGHVIKDSFLKIKFPTAFDVIFLDPPFTQNLWDASLEHIVHANLLRKDGVIYVECEKNTTIEIPPSLTIVDERTMGRMKMIFLQPIV